MCLLTADRKEDLIGRNIVEMIDQGHQAIFKERVAQAALGAQMTINQVRLIRPDGSDVIVEVTLGLRFWDTAVAVEIVMRNE